MIDEAKLLYSVKQWSEWLERASAQLYQRQLPFQFSSSHALALTGVRRCGKSHLAVQLSQNLKTPIFYFNFEDPLLLENSSLQILDKMIQLFTEWKGQQPQVLILDEIQNLVGWERWVRKAIDLNQYQILVTGSSAKMLSRELASSLAGRCLEKNIFPLSFKEMLQFLNIQIHSDAEALHQLQVYFQWGGFPEVVLSPSLDKKKEILDQYLRDLLFRDVMGRHEIHSKRSLDQLVLHYFNHPSSLHSYSAIKKAYGMSSDKAAQWTHYLNEAFLVFEVSRYHPNLKLQARDPKKIYIIDSGLRNCYSTSHQEDFGKLAENVVFIELLRRKETIYYYKADQEVDFVLVQGFKPKAALQVCYSDLENEATRMREEQALVSCLRDLKLEEGILLTKNREETKVIQKKKIKLIPLYRWLFCCIFLFCFVSTL